jgi:hypothetical protein
MKDDPGRERRCEELERVREELRDDPEEEVAADGDEAVRAVRRERSGQSPGSPLRIEKPRIDEAEMGGEAPCQLHNFWDVDAED